LSQQLGSHSAQRDDGMGDSIIGGSAAQILTHVFAHIHHPDRKYRSGDSLLRDYRIWLHSSTVPPSRLALAASSKKDELRFSE